MASWREVTDPYVKAGKLTVIGVVQEQHADRARLYKQWKKLEWPIFIDAYNVRDLEAVPVPVGVDESGIVRFTGSVTNEEIRKFVETDFGKREVPVTAVEPLPADLEAAVAADPKDARAHFRLGVALRARADSPDRKSGNAQRAVEEWGIALGLRPNQYIWRRRLQQNGPRLDKPYDFYFWVDQARKDILARGEKPVELVAEPAGSEIAPPSPAGGASPAAAAIPDPDPAGRIVRDAARIATIEPVVTPSRVRPGERIRARVSFRIDPAAKAHWNNEAEPLVLSIRLPKGVTLVEGSFSWPAPARAESDEPRILEFEAAVGGAVAAGKLPISGYALYAICEDKDGVCRFVRQDLEFTVQVDPGAIKLQ